MTKNLIINQFNLISMFDFSSNFVSTLTVRIPHCYVTLLLSKFLGGSCQEYTEAWWKIYILIVVLRSSSPPHGGGCFHHGKKEVGGCLLCEKLTMHSWLKIEKSEINWLPHSLKIILNFYFKHWLIAFYEAINFANIFLILEHYALWKADNMMMIMMMHAQEFTGVC